MMCVYIYTLYIYPHIRKNEWQESVPLAQSLVLMFGFHYPRFYCGSPMRFRHFQAKWCCLKMVHPHSIPIPWFILFPWKDIKEVDFGVVPLCSNNLKSHLQILAKQPNPTSIPCLWMCLPFLWVSTPLCSGLLPTPQITVGEKLVDKKAKLHLFPLPPGAKIK